jgi:hypothetical protein
MAKSWSIKYGTGAVSGTIVRDNIIVAGLALKDHTFGVATQESKDFTSDATAFDGIMGLARSHADPDHGQTLSKQDTDNPIEALVKQGLIKEAITSFKIPRLADKKNDGQVTFG